MTDQHKYPVADQPGLEPAPSTWSNSPTPVHPYMDKGSSATSYSQQQMYSDTHRTENGLQPVPPSEPKRRILGLTVPVFWGLVIALVIVLAAGIGGGVAGGLAAQKSSQASSGAPASTSVSTTSSLASSTTPSPATSAPTGGTSPAPQSAGCPTKDNSEYIPRDASGKGISISGGLPVQRFVQQCYTNYPGGANFGNPGIYDIMKLYTPTLEDCINTCAEWNLAYQGNLLGGKVAKGGYCRSVALITLPGEYCYLKNGTGTNNTQGHPQDFVSAVLLAGLG